MRKTAGIVTVCMLASTLVLSARAESVRVRAAATASALASAPADRDGSKILAENRALAASIDGALALQGHFWKVRAADKDKRIYYAEKVSGLEKRLRKKAEETGMKYPELYLPKNLPSEQDADSHIRQLEGAEACIDAGLANGVRFREVHLTDARAGGKGREALPMRLVFDAAGEGMPRFLTEVLRREPLVTVAELKAVRTDKGLSGEMLAEESRYGKDAFGSFVPAEKDAKDLRAEVRLTEKTRASLMQAEFLRVKEDTPAPVAEAKTAVRAAERQSAVFRGLAKKKGQPCAVIEDTSRGEVAFLTVGETAGGLRLVSLADDAATVEDVRTKKQETLKREIE